MKLIRMVALPSWGDLGKFCKEHLPDTLEAKLVCDGYSWDWEVRIKEEPPPGWWKRLTHQAPLVAYIDRLKIILKRPEWLSDFQDVIRKYEQERNVEVTLEYWESPTAEDLKKQKEAKAGAGQRGD